MNNDIKYISIVNKLNACKVVFSELASDDQKTYNVKIVQVKTDEAKLRFFVLVDGKPLASTRKALANMLDLFDANRAVSECASYKSDAIRRAQKVILAIELVGRRSDEYDAFLVECSPRLEAAAAKLATAKEMLCKLI